MPRHEHRSGEKRSSKQRQPPCACSTAEVPPTAAVGTNDCKVAGLVSTAAGAHRPQSAVFWLSIVSTWYFNLEHPLSGTETRGVEDRFGYLCRDVQGALCTSLHKDLR